VEKNLVKLITITPDSEKLIAYIARVSNPANQNNTETAPKLLKYLIKNKHWSPFEHSYLTVEIKTSRAIAAQILRHRSFTFQEFSQRYSAVTEDSFVYVDARKQDLKNRQNSTPDCDEATKEWFETAQWGVNGYCYSLYEKALEKGIAKECARNLLPLSTETTIYMTGSVRSWITYFLVRLDKSTQKEHRDVAWNCYLILKEQCPETAKTLEQIYPDIFNEN
jgi:thymidylate synthase (FAD)